MNQVREEIKKLGSEAFSEAYAPLFNQYPEVESVSWTQYTPYFNDGDSCTFSVRELRINGEEEWDANESMEALFKIFKEVHNQDNEIFLQCFGDHVEVTITRDGNVDVSEYSHD